MTTWSDPGIRYDHMVRPRPVPYPGVRYDHMVRPRPGPDPGVRYDHMVRPRLGQTKVSGMTTW